MAAMSSSWLELEEGVRMMRDLPRNESLNEFLRGHEKEHATPALKLKHRSCEGYCVSRELNAGPIDIAHGSDGFYH
jgi:hypothetical protein